ncbi:MAG: helix-turn-helix domain-containing protein [Natronosporangium sp.]
MTIDGTGLAPGERIRLFRRRAGLTQEQCAQLKGCTVSAWRKWESGGRRVSGFADWVAIARILGVRDVYKLTGLPAGELPQPPADHEAVPAIRAALFRFDPDLSRPPDLDRLAAQVDRAWTVWQERRSFAEVGALLPRLVTELRATVARADRAEREPAVRLTVLLYFLVRAFTKRVGAQDLALVVADRATAAAQSLADPGWQAAAAWNLGMTLYPQGHAEVVAALARDAAAQLRPRLAEAPAEWWSVVGALHLLRAVQLFRLRGEHAALGELEAAEAIGRRTGDRNDFRIFFGPTNVGIHRVWLALEQTRPAEAIRLADQYDVTGAPSVQRRFAHFVILARAYCMRNEDVAAVHMLLRAERESAWDLRYHADARAVVRDLLRRENSLTRVDLRPLAERLGILAA